MKHRAISTNEHAMQTTLNENQSTAKLLHQLDYQSRCVVEHSDRLDPNAEQHTPLMQGREHCVLDANNAERIEETEQDLFFKSIAC